MKDKTKKALAEAIRVVTKQLVEAPDFYGYIRLNFIDGTMPNHNIMKTVRNKVQPEQQENKDE